jgi:phage terminase large subunit-like protein
VIVDSRLDALVRRLGASLGASGARLALRSLVDSCSPSERAWALHNWLSWARPQQLAPSGEWKTWGLLTGRAWGKTATISNFINQEAEAGRAKLIGLAGQNEQTCIDVQILGKSGLLATSPPWFKATWHPASLQVTWPNGARAYVRSPEAPANVRGLELDIAWLSEIQSWPVVGGRETLVNFDAATRAPGCRIVWDSTPKSRHSLVKELLAQAEAEPALYRITRGRMGENALSLDRGYVERMQRKYGGTQQGREEIEGEMLSENENALFRAEWIDRNRRPLPPAFTRRAIGVDPATAGAGRGRDKTGIVEAGLGTDGRLYVIRDDTAKFDLPETWGELLLDHYFAHGIDLICCECNEGGALVASIVRMTGKLRGVKVEMLGRDDPYPYQKANTVFVKEVWARRGQDKSARAAPLSIAYQKNQVSHVIGASLADLEDCMLSWDPSQKNNSPDALDALVWAASELLDLAGDAPMPAYQPGDIAATLDLSRQLHGARVGQTVSVGGMAVRYDGSSSLRDAIGGGDSIGGGDWGGGRI